MYFEERDDGPRGQCILLWSFFKLSRWTTSVKCVGPVAFCMIDGGITCLGLGMYLVTLGFWPLYVSEDSHGVSV